MTDDQSTPDYRSMNEVDLAVEQERGKHNTYESTKSTSMTFRTTDIILYYAGIIYVIFQTHSVDMIYKWDDITVLVFLFTGMILQFTIGILMLILKCSNREKIGKNCTATRINDIVCALSALSQLLNGMLNIFYSGGIASKTIAFFNATK